MVQLLTRMYKAGVPIVSGTDGSGIEIIRELEVYHEAGLTNAEALPLQQLHLRASLTWTRKPAPSK